MYSLFLQGPDFGISHEDFLHFVLPSLNDDDTVLLLYTHLGERGGEKVCLVGVCLHYK